MRDALDSIQQLQELKEEMARQGRQLTTLHRNFKTFNNVSNSQMQSDSDAKLEKTVKKEKDQPLTESVAGFKPVLDYNTLNKRSDSTEEKKVGQGQPRELKTPTGIDSFSKRNKMSTFGVSVGSDVSFFEDS